jgi:hypothetical protein
MASDVQNPGRPSRVAQVLAFLLIFGTAVVLLCWTWETWPDVLVDFGQQLYIPWQVSEGKVLYRDLAYYNGPLSVYANAALFRLFGVGLRTLVVGNLVLLGLLVALLYHVFRRTGGAGSATIVCSVFLCAFAFAQYVGFGNYNYVCPYSHEMTHGLLFGLAALACAWNVREDGREWFMTSGLCLGLAFLTKAEVFTGGAVATTLAVAIQLKLRGVGFPARLVDAAVFLVAFLIPPVSAFALFALAMPMAQAFRGTVGSWIGVFNTELVRLPFFHEGTGLNDVSGNLRIVLEWLGIYALVVVPSVLLGMFLPASRPIRVVSAAVAFVAVLALIWAKFSELEWDLVPRPLPLVMLAVAIASSVDLLRAWRTGRDAQPALRRMTLAVFAFVLLGKMILNARIYHYGFVAAMPAALVFVAVLVDWLPTAIERTGGSGAVLRAAALAAIFVFVAGCLVRQASWRALKIHCVGSGADGFWADARGKDVNACVRVIDAQVPRNATLLAVPEGIMLNYLSRRQTPTRFTNFMPTEMVLFGEDRTFDILRAHPADVIALVHKDTREFGPQFFGRDYGQSFFAWVGDHYTPFARFGAEPLKTDEFGIILLRRNVDAPRD